MCSDKDTDYKMSDDGLLFCACLLLCVHACSAMAVLMHLSYTRIKWSMNIYDSHDAIHHQITRVSGLG